MTKQQFNPSNFFEPAILKPGEAEAVFSLLFAFSNDSACLGPELRDFDTELAELLPGASYSTDIRDKLEIIFQKATSLDTSIEELASDAALSINFNKNHLLTIANILLEECQTDGIVCAKASLKFKNVFDAFKLSDNDWLSFSDETVSLKNLVLDKAFLSEEDSAFSPSRDVSELYAVLECSPQNSISEVKASYRKLVKKYHPDALTEHDEISSFRDKFEKVQEAYTQILNIRQDA